MDKRSKQSMRKLVKRYRIAITPILLREWDPIGVAAYTTIQDEYDEYVNGLCGILMRHEPRERLVQYMQKVENENMGMAGASPKIEIVVDLLLQIREEIETTPE
jgi:hypothetical protein